MGIEGRLNGLDLFSGIGGNSIALHEYVKVIAYCEVNKYAQAVLLSKMRNGSLDPAPIWDDIQTLNTLDLEHNVDLITGGFPCQDISVAGHGKGLAGERSGLFFEIIRLTKEIRPAFVFLENVPAIRTRGLDQVIKAFTSVGYDCRWTCLSASSVGAPHKRERWFLLAHTDSHRSLEGLALQTKDKNKSFIINGPSPKRSFTDSMCEGLERQRQEPGRIRKKQSDISEYGWGPSPPAICGMDDGIAFRVDRIKCLGNSVVPMQAKIAFEKLMGIE